MAATGIRTLILSDIAKIRERKGRVLPFLAPNLLACVCYRVSHALSQRGAAKAAWMLFIVGHFFTGSELDPHAVIGPGLMLEHTSGVVVGPGVVAGRDLVLYGQALLGSTWHSAISGFPTLGDGVQVLAKASVLGPITIGDGAVIGAHALALTDVPPGAVAKGIPARIT